MMVMGHDFLRFHLPSNLPGNRKSRNARAVDRPDVCKSRTSTARQREEMTNVSTTQPGKSAPGGQCSFSVIEIPIAGQIVPKTNMCCSQWNAGQLLRQESSESASKAQLSTLSAAIGLSQRFRADRLYLARNRTFHA
ncbi:MULTISPECIES: hypothetical protein [Rhizobium]|uniref:hypothetical protein n=1 Tax=Rhizobium phaseoli TaxID=396 RepID=UPI000F745D50|nr:hypothetical protein [Rhizobium phaseoli]